MPSEGSLCFKDGTLLLYPHMAKWDGVLPSTSSTHEGRALRTESTPKTPPLNITSLAIKVQNKNLGWGQIQTIATFLPNSFLKRKHTAFNTTKLCNIYKPTRPSKC